MELTQLRSFLPVAELLHFSRAAERVHLSQPALSLQIRALEHELGLTLFDRDRRKTELTVAGQVFREEIAGVMDRIESATMRARQAAAGKVGCLRIGFISTAAEIVPPLVTEFRKSHPLVYLEMHHALTAEQIELLDGGSLDVGFYREPSAPHRGIRTVVVHREPFKLFLPSSHPLARAGDAGLDEIDGQDFLIYARRNAPGFHDFLLRSVIDSGATPDTIH